MQKKEKLEKTPFWTMKTTKVRNEAGEEETVGEVRIYGYIVEDSWWDDDTTPKSFVDELKSLGDIKTLHVRINSYGGHVSAGSAIYSILKQHQANVVVHVDGFALSAASVVAMAGDTVIVYGNSMMMIHNPSALVAGEAKDFRKKADVLDKMRDAMISAYHDKTGLSRDELIQMLDDETWFTADEAVEKGFADIAEEPLMAVATVKPGVLAVNGMEFDLTGYHNLPEKLKKEMEECNLKNQNAAVPTGQGAPIVPIAPGTDAHGALSEEISKAVSAERERMKALDDLLIPGAEDIIAKAKYETGISPEQAALEMIKSHKLAGNIAFEARQADAENSGVNGLNTVNNGAGLGKTDPAAEKAKVLKEAIEKGREGK
jgi:ATP-dependent protease ClpP protease subunit